MNFNSIVNVHRKTVCAIIMPAKFADMTEEEMECDGGFPWIAVNCVLGCVCGAVSAFSTCMAVFGDKHRGAWAITAVVTAAAAGCFFWNANRMRLNSLNSGNYIEAKVTSLDKAFPGARALSEDPARHIVSSDTIDP